VADYEIYVFVYLNIILTETPLFAFFYQMSTKFYTWYLINILPFLNFSTLLLRQVQLEVKLRVEVKDFVEINCRTKVSNYMQEALLYYILMQFKAIIILIIYSVSFKINNIIICYYLYRFTCT
jgi:hypothetical protein